MHKPKCETTAGDLFDAVSDLRETLFGIAEDATRLDTRGQSRLYSFIQTANYNLSKAEAELSALSCAPAPVTVVQADNTANRAIRLLGPRPEPYEAFIQARSA
jgi:hypothetical protein